MVLYIYCLGTTPARQDLMHWVSSPLNEQIPAKPQLLSGCSGSISELSSANEDKAAVDSLL